MKIGKKQNVKAIKKELVKLCSQIVMLRDKRCLRCGKTERLAASHIKSVGSHPGMRFDLDNIIALCYFCHIHWWHREILGAAEWITLLKGEKFMERLDLKSRYVWKRYYSDYEALYFHYTKLHEQLRRAR